MTSPDIVIIGAPRSGTNMLRDILASRAGVVTWPCDEINDVWRHGSRDFPTDEIPKDRANARMRRFVEVTFDRLRRQGRGVTVVEKTCANSLRVEYVAALLPVARFVLITRDGVDATASALKRWYAPLDWHYTARKARFVPPSDIAYATLRFAKDRLVGRDRRAKAHHTWGPRFVGIDEMTRSHPLEEVCAFQWQRCVELSHAALRAVPSERVYQLSYEDFVQKPGKELVSLLDFLGLSTGDADSAVAGVSALGVGRGRTSLGAEATTRIERILSPTLERLGYA